jgi:hypothetical protein
MDRRHCLEHKIARNVGLGLEYSFLDFGSQHYHPRRMTACCAVQPDFLRIGEEQAAHRQGLESLAPKSDRKKSMIGHHLRLHCLYGANA